MDDVDQRLIAELRRDGRAALSDLAERLELSRATVRARMERLTARGEIAGFTVVTRADVTAAPVRGLMMIGIEGRGGERIMARLAGIPPPCQPEHRGLRFFDGRATHCRQTCRRQKKLRRTPSACPSRGLHPPG